MNPVLIAAYIETRPAAAPTVKQHLAAIRMLFDFLVTGQVVPVNPASSVRGPKYVVKRGKTPVLEADEARALIDSIKIDSIVGLRDRAIIGTMCYTFGPVSAMVTMRVDGYFQNGKRWWFRLHEKGGNRHEVPAHYNAEAYMDAYLDVTGIRADPKSPLFRERRQPARDHAERHDADAPVEDDKERGDRGGAPLLNEITLDEVERMRFRMQTLLAVNAICQGTIPQWEDCEDSLRGFSQPGCS